MVKVLKALSNPVRLKILALCSIKERSSRELRELLNLSKPLLIVHLRKLLDAGLLEYRAELDERRMITRKYYRTIENLKICIDIEILSRIAEMLESRKRHDV